MDKSHWTILQQMNIIEALSKNGVDIKPHVLYVYDLLEKHCDEEEALMELHQYPFRAYHVLEHRSLMKFLKSMIENRSYNLKGFVADLSKSFLSHIDHMDMQYSYYLNKQRPV